MAGILRSPLNATLIGKGPLHLVSEPFGSAEADREMSSSSSSHGVRRGSTEDRQGLIKEDPFLSLEGTILNLNNKLDQALEELMRSRRRIDLPQNAPAMEPPPPPPPPAPDPYGHYTPRMLASTYTPSYSQLYSNSSTWSPPSSRILPPQQQYRSSWPVGYPSPEMVSSSLVPYLQPQYSMMPQSNANSPPTWYHQSSQQHPPDPYGCQASSFPALYPMSYADPFPPTTWNHQQQQHYQMATYVFDEMPVGVVPKHEALVMDEMHVREMLVGEPEGSEGNQYAGQENEAEEMDQAIGSKIGGQTVFVGNAFENPAMDPEGNLVRPISKMQPDSEDLKPEQHQLLVAGNMLVRPHVGGGATHLDNAFTSSGIFSEPNLIKAIDRMPSSSMNSNGFLQPTKTFHLPSLMDKQRPPFSHIQEERVEPEVPIGCLHGMPTYSGDIDPIRERKIHSKVIIKIPVRDWKDETSHSRLKDVINIPGPPRGNIPTQHLNSSCHTEHDEQFQVPITSSSLLLNQCPHQMLGSVQMVSSRSDKPFSKEFIAPLELGSEKCQISKVLFPTTNGSFDQPLNSMTNLSCLKPVHFPQGVENNKQGSHAEANDTNAKSNENVVFANELRDARPTASVGYEKGEVLGVFDGVTSRSGNNVDKTLFVNSSGNSNLTSVSGVHQTLEVSPNFPEINSADAKGMKIEDSNLGNSICVILEERLEAASALKKQIWTDAQLDKRPSKEGYMSKLQYSSLIELKDEVSQKNVAIERGQTPTTIITSSSGCHMEVDNSISVICNLSKDSGEGQGMVWDPGIPILLVHTFASITLPKQIITNVGHSPNEVGIAAEHLKNLAFMEWDPADVEAVDSASFLVMVWDPGIQITLPMTLRQGQNKWGRLSGTCLEERPCHHLSTYQRASTPSI